MQSEYLKDDGFLSVRIQMVEDQIKRRGVVDAVVLNAFQEIPRHRFVPEEYHIEAYHDHPIPIGFGQTISQPFIVALMTELLQLQGTEVVLEIGTGSGYQAAILSRLCKEVHTVERIPELSYDAQKVFDDLEMTNIHTHISDGSLGWPDAAPYSAIIVTAAAPSLPQPLKEQLQMHGRLVIPIGSRWHQELQVWEISDSGFAKESVIPVVFVPLLGKWGWDKDSPKN